jgi:hypothetical protein
MRRVARGEASACGISFDEDLPRAQRTLSPSDLGFHNAIRESMEGSRLSTSRLG